LIPFITSKINQEFVDYIIPLISEKVMLLIKPKIAKIVDECMQPHLKTTQHNKDALISISWYSDITEPQAGSS
jgi:hypothetical protein